MLYKVRCTWSISGADYTGKTVYLIPDLLHRVQVSAFARVSSDDIALLRNKGMYWGVFSYICTFGTWTQLRETSPGKS